ncbi:DOPA 4,5-dioxygenase family protein [Parendozoicomonas haliclonae]|uniref:Dopa 4,5-dioxygenase family n=1 Tax=Parendozoicomonas haliclonae TaxID=1960125 RepID=A0A1X7AJ83_9GAMM|nr:DOPA 4,5-dioxygenase family protein [Parendozoicomonas haliclonae]SMA45398.1 Dopa 4,5-dioxygenase family [Parendozoicomonas haliclonae]
MSKPPVNIHKVYHAHVYFDQSTLAFATELCEQAGQKFGLKVGRVHQKNVGPHTRWSCQILFTFKDFEPFIPWLDANRDGLSVLVHGVTGDDLKDHTDYAYWLGEAVEVNLEGLK